MLGLPHLDREFDYLVPEELSDEARPGTRVRIRFAGRLVDAYCYERLPRSNHDGELSWLQRVISPEIVLPPELRELVDAVAARWMGVRSDILRLAVPPRHATTEKSVPAAIEPVAGALPGPVELPEGWADHPMVAHFLEAAFQGGSPRGVWTVPPGRDWTEALADLSDSVRRRGRQVLIVVPDQHDVDRLAAACRERTGAKDLVSDLSASLGPSARYRRWLRALRGHARILVGTRSAVFAPLPELGMVILHDDSDESYVEPRAPYPHTRDVALLRSQVTGLPLLLTAPDRTPEVARLLRTGWAHEIQPEPGVVRASAPRVEAITDSDPRQARDVAGGNLRLPTVALTMARGALDRDEPVLVQVPRRGYIPTLLCGSCRAPARCRHCNGPLRAGRMDAVLGPVDLECGWCGAPEPKYACTVCGSRGLRAGVVGAERTAEEFGRMFPGVRIRTSSGSSRLTAVPAQPAVVVATPGTEPVAEGLYGCALLLDTWALLGRPDLRAHQHTLRRWIGAAGLVRPGTVGGQVFCAADAALPVAQALVRWDPQGWADRELDERAEVGFPPAVHMIAIDGPAEALADVIVELETPPGVELLGPVELPPGAELPGHDEIDEPERLLLRVPPVLLREATAQVRALIVGRSSRRAGPALRVHLDPTNIG